MNISELARILKVSPQELRDKLPQLGFDIGQKAIKIDNSVANKIIKAWPAFIKQFEVKKANDARQKVGPDQVAVEKKKLLVPSFIPVRDFAALAGLPINTVLSELMKNGIFASLNERIDFDTMAIIAEYLGLEVELRDSESVDNNTVSLRDIMDKEDKADLEVRPPVIVVMGHVDHGKTKTLDAIRRTNVIDGEAGGITQHIGAYQVVRRNKLITFIDTPGHEAFTAMRSRGAKIADAAILVIAADDGVKPQTIEAFKIIEAAKLPFVVAINKIDKPDANIDKTKQELATRLNITPEDWGGKTICVPISAKDGTGIEQLLDMILLIADVEAENMKFNPNSPAVGTVIESHINKNEGPVATVLVQNGVLRVGDCLCFNGFACGKVRSLKNYRGEDIQEATAAVPTKILGLKMAPEVGDLLQVGIGERVKTRKMKSSDNMSDVKSEESSNIKKVNLVIKSDVLGSAEAIAESLEKIGNSEVRANIIYRGLGNVGDGDIKRAEASGALILGFNVKVPSQIEELARDRKVTIQTYSIIYDLINEVKRRMQDLLEPEIVRKDLGKMRVKAIFRTETKSQIVGGLVISGLVEKDSQVEIWRKGNMLETGKMGKLKSGKEDVTVVEESQECGVMYEGSPIIEVGDELHFYKEDKIIKKL